MTMCDYEDLEILHEHIWYYNDGYVSGKFDGKAKKLHNKIMDFP